jgi:hypothetical protein
MGFGELFSMSRPPIQFSRGAACKQHGKLFEFVYAVLIGGRSLRYMHHIIT